MRRAEQQKPYERRYRTGNRPGAAGFFLYVYGWIAIRRRGYRRLAGAWRLGSAVGGTLAVLAALLPPITALETRSFAAHMVQHELLIEVAPTLWWLAQPAPFWL